MGEMVKTPVFWLTVINVHFSNAAGTMMVSFTSPIAQRQVGWTAMTSCIMCIHCDTG